MKKGDFLPETILLEAWLRFCEGDRDAFSALVDEHFTPLYHYGTRFSQDKDLIKDCVQDLFLDIWEKRANLRHVVGVRPYLFQSLRNNLIYRVKRASRVTVGDLDDQVSNGHSVESAWINAETDDYQHQLLSQGIESLPKRQREALYLRYYEDLSHDEIAAIMGLQRQAVANYIHYGIQKLRDYWKYKAVLLLCLASYAGNLFSLT